MGVNYGGGFVDDNTGWVSKRLGVGGEGTGFGDGNGKTWGEWRGGGASLPGLVVSHQGLTG